MGFATWFAASSWSIGDMRLQAFSVMSPSSDRAAPRLLPPTEHEDCDEIWHVRAAGGSFDVRPLAVGSDS